MLISPSRQRRIARNEPDERLVERVRAGDREAFEAVYDRYSSGLLSFCRHLLGSLEEAEDAVQHTFIAAHRAMLGDRRELHLKAWLYAIARNRCLSMLRARRERVALDEDMDALPSTAGLSTEVEQREDLRELLGDLNRLPDDQRAALVLAEMGAHSHDEIAEVLGVKRPKVKALVFQAREALAAARTARDTPCEEIREELAVAHGGALRRGNLRRHLEVCAGCRTFRDEVQRQRVAFASVLPVVPSFALKQAVLAAAAAGGTAGAGAAGVATIAGAGGIKAATTKMLAALVLAGGAGGSGYVAVHEVDKSADVPAAAAGATPTGQASARRIAVTPSEETTPLPPRPVTAPVTHRAERRAAKTRRQRERVERAGRNRDRGDKATTGEHTEGARDAGTVDAAAPAPAKHHKKGKLSKEEKQAAKEQKRAAKEERKAAKKEQHEAKQQAKQQAKLERRRRKREQPLADVPGQLKKAGDKLKKAVQGPPRRRKKKAVEVPVPAAPAKPKKDQRGAAAPQDKAKPEKQPDVPKGHASSLPLLGG